VLWCGVMSDHHHGGYDPAYVYPDNNYQYSNNSLTSFYGSQRSSPNKRIFDAASVSASASISFDASIPIPDLDSAIYINVPFSFSFPSERSLATGRSFSSGGGLGSGRDSPRTILYKGIEKYMGHMTGADGQACLLRAMCEASSTPLHDEGLIGDAVTFLLTSNYASEESDDRFKRYFAAQAKGQLTGDCSELHAECPISLFKFIDENIV